MNSPIVHQSLISSKTTHATTTPSQLKKNPV